MEFRKKNSIVDLSDSAMKKSNPVTCWTTARWRCRHRELSHQAISMFKNPLPAALHVIKRTIAVSLKCHNSQINCHYYHRPMLIKVILI